MNHLGTSAYQIISSVFWKLNKIHHKFIPFIGIVRIACSPNALASNDEEADRKIHETNEEEESSYTFQFTRTKLSEPVRFDSNFNRIVKEFTIVLITSNFDSVARARPIFLSADKQWFR